VSVERWLPFFLVLVSSVLALTACRASTAADFGATDIALSLAPDKPAVGPATLTFTLSDKKGRPVAGATVRVEGTMTHAGMEPVKVTAQPGGDGRYTAPDFRFTMAGDWLLIAQATLADGSTSQRTFRIAGVTGGAGQGP